MELSIGNEGVRGGKGVSPNDDPGRAIPSLMIDGDEEKQKTIGAPLCTSSSTVGSRKDE